MSAGLLGCILTPKQGNRLPERAVWCADNGCFGKGYPGDAAWLAWLADHAADAGRCLFAVAPDVVGDAVASVARSLPFLPLVRALGYPVALAAQNGLTPGMVPWDAIDVLFLGGSPECLPCGYVRPAQDRERTACPSCRRPLAEWKLSRAARRMVAEAKRHGKRAHMGRVNSLRRFLAAQGMGCDSADGTFVAAGPDVNLPIVMGWLRAANDQGVLWAS